MDTCCNDSSQQQPFAKTICSICYEDLKPIVEDLQAISICGHVFHELCIQQWFEYCKGKKKCPICKQTCSAANVSRLYFQSVGDSNDSNISQKPQSRKLDPEELQVECKRLEGKVKGLSLTLESRDNDLKSIINELCICKEQLIKESALKKEALEQKHTINRLLNVKAQELNKSDEDLKKLRELNKALAQEVCAFKLATSLDLDEDEIDKYASFGREGCVKDTVATLKESLLFRIKAYKDLLNSSSKQTGELEKDKKSLSKKLEKANGEVEKLKTRIRNIEFADEVRENEVLRSLKSSNKTKSSPSVPNVVEHNFSDTYKPSDTIKEPDVNPRNGKRLREFENINESNNNDGVSSYILIDDDVPEIPISPDSVPQPTKRPTIVHNVAPLPKYTDDGSTPVHEIGQDYTLPNIRKETSLPVFNSQEVGDICFSGGILCPDGTKRHLGKWCKKAQTNNASVVPTQVSGNLIAVGADGRGGTIKVLKSSNPSSFVSKGPSFSAKTVKFGAKPSSMQSSGSLQIDHFFSKAGR